METTLQAKLDKPLATKTEFSECANKFKAIAIVEHLLQFNVLAESSYNPQEMYGLSRKIFKQNNAIFDYSRHSAGAEQVICDLILDDERTLKLSFLNPEQGGTLMLLRDFTGAPATAKQPTLELYLHSNKKGIFGMYAVDFGLSGEPNFFATLDGKNPVTIRRSNYGEPVPDDVTNAYAKLLDLAYTELVVSPIKHCESIEKELSEARKSVWQKLKEKMRKK